MRASRSAARSLTSAARSDWRWPARSFVCARMKISSVGRPRKSLSGRADALDGGCGAESAWAALEAAASWPPVELASLKKVCGRP
jgi:hypothetical protein